MSNNYTILIDRLDAFIRKYYTNLLIKGALYSIALLGSFFLVLALFESLVWFSATVRTIFFYTYIALGLFVIIRYVVIPILKLYKIGDRLSHEMAASVIGKHFNEVKDTLLNTLQLKRLSLESPESYDLIMASINKKSERLMNVPFRSVIKFSSNKKYLYLALFPLLIISALLLASPTVLTESSRRLVNHSVEFEKPLPFEIKIKNNSLEAIQQEDFTLEIELYGNEIPSDVSLVMNGNEFSMQPQNKLSFSYTFKKIQKDQEFKLLAAGYHSDSYKITVVPRPIVLNYEIELMFPSYIGKANEVISNVGDINVPQGTILNWRLYTRDTETILFKIGDKIDKLTSGKTNTFTTSHKLMTGTKISINSQNKYLLNTDSLLFYANVVPDLHPTINVEQYKDSIYDNRLYFRGLISDDHGFKSLQFKLLDKNGTVEKSFNVSFQAGSNEQNFYYYFDLLSQGVDPGKEITYYFEVWDNDGVNGSKSARSREMTFRIPTTDELSALVDKHSHDLKEDFNNSINEAKEIRREVEKLNEKLIDKKELNYQDKKQIENLLERHKNLQSKIDQMKLENQQMNSKESQIKKSNKDIIEKQKRLEKLFDELMTDEMKKMLSELQKLMEELDKDKVREALDKIKNQSEDIEKDLDRNLELFKQLEFDKKLTDAIEDLKKLSEEEKRLSEETEDANKKESDRISKEQEELNKKFEEIKKDLDELEEINKELEEPRSLEMPEQDQQDIESEMKESNESLKDSQMKKASSHQKKASEKMEQMSDKLDEMQQSMEQEQLGEDMDALRQILENLVKSSFDQENLMARIKSMNRSDPKYPSAVEEQKKIMDNLKMVEDSLLTLSKRQAMIESFVNKEIRDINENGDLALEALQNRSIGMANSKQQYVMTAVNNLALMLSEAFKEMEEQMDMKSSGQSGKNQPMLRRGKASMKSMRQMQEKLNQQMEQLRQGMKPEKGQQGVPGKGSTSEQLARMAAQQEALRKMLQEYQEELQKEGEVDQPGLNKSIQDMEKSESEMVNKIINQQTMKRQQEILTRMLESEKAEEQREQEERRESNEAQDIPHPDPARYFESIGLPSRETELIHTIPPSLRGYYRNKVNSYFIQIPIDSNGN